MSKKMKTRPLRDEPGARYRVRAVEKALDLLSAFHQDARALSLAELAERTDIPRPTIVRLLSTLETRGFVRRNGTAYSLGFRCFVLGNVVRADLDVIREAQSFLEWLRNTSGETTQLAILEGWHVVQLARAHSHQPIVYTGSQIGSVLPAYCTAHGKALLAERPRNEVVAWSRTQQFKRLTPATYATADELLVELDRTRERGFATDNEERELGVSCIAAPVRDDTGTAIAAVGAAGPTARMPRQLEGSELAEHVIACATAISERMGYVRAT